MKKFLVVAIAVLVLLIYNSTSADFLENYPANGAPVTSPQLRENLNQLWQFTKKFFNPTLNGNTVSYTGGKASFGNKVYTIGDGSIDFSNYTGMPPYYVSVVESEGGGAATLSMDSGSYNPNGIPLWNVFDNNSTGYTLNDDRTWARNSTVTSELPTLTATLSADVPFPANDVFVDGPSLTLTPGKWLVIGQVSLQAGTSSNAYVTAKLWDGSSNVYSSGEHHVGSGETGATLYISSIMTLTSTTTIKISCATTAIASTCYIKSALVHNPTGNNATMLKAINISSVMSGGGGGISSFNGRTGVVSPQSGDYTAAMIGLGNVTNDAQVKRTEMGTASGVATLNSSSLVTQNPANATAVPSANKIPIADSNGKLDSWITAGSSGRLLSRTILTSGTSYTTPAGCSKIFVQMVGGGGGGGAVIGLSGNSAAGGGGGAGGYAEKLFNVSPNTIYSYVIGAGGNGVANQNGTGGGATTFTVGSTTVTAYGGAGGYGTIYGISPLAISGGSGGGALNADMYGVGENGGEGIRLSGTVAISGAGGSSIFSAGGKSKTDNGYSSANGYGGGGSGGLTTTASSYKGGDGAPGVIIVWEYSN